jgi:hypothetical protein
MSLPFVLHRKPPDLRLQVLHARAFDATSLTGGGEHVARAFEQLRLPLGDLMRVNIEALSELRQRLIALHGRHGHLRLERR